jgi:SAM-dependent methyltransferase
MKLDLAPLKNPPLNAHYEGSYDPAMLRWREIGAADKAANIVTLLGNHTGPLSSVLEVGCGTGAVLLALKRAGIGTSHIGVDMADPNLHPHPGVVEADITMLRQDEPRLPFDDKSFDFVFASHVLEHVADERGFLAELARVTRRWIYLEVPCELHLRASISTLQTTLNIGHINAYTPESFALTLATGGLDIAGIEAFDHSFETHAFQSGAGKARVKMALRRSLLKVSPVMASRIFAYHVGALCTPTLNG